MCNPPHAMFKIPKSCRIIQIGAGVLRRVKYQHELKQIPPNLHKSTLFPQSSLRQQTRNTKHDNLAG